MLFSELKRHIQSRELFPAYIVTGEDAFLVSSALRFFRALAQPMEDFNLSEITSPDSVNAITDVCESLPLGGELRVVIVSQCKVDLTPLKNYLDNPCPSTVLVFETEKPEKNFASILNRLTVVDCSKLDKETVFKWIAAKTKECGATITERAARTLTEFCAGDMSRISSETEKLCAYRYGGKIDEEDVVTLTAPTLDFKIFALSEAVANKQTEKAALVLKNLLESGVAPVMLLGMLYSHFRRLLYVAITPAYDRMAADLGVKEFAVKKAREQAARYTPKRLKKICDSLMSADYDFKSGKIGDKTALELVVFNALSA